ncbi:hypothetical protein CSE45_4267 [Citreicella sp. SE45]|nr:hypothetical protein CSE45_4267 [Citreicella sp. SE45]
MGQDISPAKNPFVQKIIVMRRPFGRLQKIAICVLQNNTTVTQSA